MKEPGTTQRRSGGRTRRGAIAGRPPGFRIRSGAWVTGSTS
jgi:hypothetical protein